MEQTGPLIQFLRALLLHRNTPDRDTGLSPAQVIFGRTIRNFFPVQPERLKMHPEWRITMEQRERALAKRHARRGKDLQEHTRALAPLQVGQVVLIQNQSGNNPRRWQKSGRVVEVLPFDQYRVKLDGTGRSSLRNRKFLRPITPFSELSRKESSNRDEEQTEGKQLRRSERIGKVLESRQADDLTLKELKRGEA